MSRRRGPRAVLWRALLAGMLGGLVWLLGSPAAAPGAATMRPAAAVMTPPAPSLPTLPAVPSPPAAPSAPAPGGSAGSSAGDGSVTVNFDHIGGKPSQSITIILLLTVLSIAPALLILCTSFTKIIVVLGLARNALGTQSIPPNQVLAGLALFLSLFVMAPTLSQMNSEGVQPYLHGQKTQAQALHDGTQPLRDWMLRQTRKDELATMTAISSQPKPATREDTPFTTLIPAFVLSELKSAFIIGFVVFVPFLVVDLVVSSSLMSMGMMMLPPTLISLPFKLLLFVMVDGWGLIVHSLVASYH